MSEQEKIIVRGARTHNLKNITVEMPRNKLIAITGLSGSGKSSLAFDTIFAEGQRRYIESLSAYARQFLRQIPKPDVDEIVGLSPAISIDQKSPSQNPRSTVATVTEIYDYLRVLFARVGRAYCLVCGHLIERLAPAEIINFIQQKIKKLQKAGQKKSSLRIYAPIVRGRKGEYYQLLYDLLAKGFEEVLVDGKQKKLRERIVLSRYKKHQIDALVDEIAPSEFMGVEFSERLSEAVERALSEADGLVRIYVGEENFIMSARFACPHDGFSYPEIEPRLFSFNSPHGACPECHGLGTRHFYGSDTCDACAGARLRPEALGVKIKKKNITEVAAMSISEAAEFFADLGLSVAEQKIADVVLKEIDARLRFLLDVGLDYLTLDRRANTLAGGEAQRIRLASQLGSRLVGALYVLDEPTVGLHPKDNARLIKTLHELRDLGNTIIVVEHDEDTIYSSDYLIDLGPGAGRHGGEVVVSGETDKLLTAKKNSSNSLTLDYLRGEQEVPMPRERREGEKGALKIRGASVFNLNNLKLDVPLGRLVAISGVSGSGKSSVLYEVLYKNLRARLDRRYRSSETLNCREFLGSEYLSRLVLVDQSPIGRTPRSNPATYTGAFTFIRELFAETETARAKGFGPGRFSFNVKGGRCEACQGNGLISVEMHFLPTIFVECDICHEKRYEPETLSVFYQHKNISEVLKMTVDEALEFFGDIPAINDRLTVLSEVGLGYLRLGQSATTLSGGEAQRVKISAELHRPQREKTIYLLDEPTVGLHYEDVKNLLAVLHRLVSRGNTVVIIEHNLEVIKNADWLIDLGPEGGEKGGRVVAVGTPEEVSRSADSYTAKYLRRVLANAGRAKSQK